ncbi:alpha/beta fold hydrolase [Candidatus Uabimicrobium amorphum]|uniref:GH29D-like beta-sandwich domain-containing protein n=1 Tax=Uabimicrobium amorphum TaxID=2596890 RepID=A0A5S9F3W3_UABAM|nr:alpha/beta fold hydrolase [Candidatus Uabimicrobium amorphum]BBM85175.1 hypothetical protein UABAM_03538 [Candidatus Uabimicrobium amorphum]
MNKIVLFSISLFIFAIFPAAEDIDGFPKDFPQLYDSGGNGYGSALSGFGGNHSLDREGNRKAISKNPVILLHGNGGNAHHPQWGMLKLRSFLKEKGYNHSEIWAVSYLGPDNSDAELPDPHRNNINDVRSFIDAVREYLDVQKVDIISHSLGGTLVKSYLMGLREDGSWDKSLRRFDAVGTVVTMAAGNYGLGAFSVGEFQTGGAFEAKIHSLDGVKDDTPYGSSEGSSQKGPYQKVSKLDNDQITYVAVWAEGDFVDMQNPKTGRLEGADFNRGYNLGWGLEGHEKIIKDKNVFNGFASFLNTKTNKPPKPAPPVITISPNGGEFIGKVNVYVRATNKPEVVFYTTDGESWQRYEGPFTLTEDSVVKAKAENKYGKSLEVSVTFTKSATPPYKKVLATATEHYMAGRIDNQKYIELGSKYGYIDPFYLYLIEGSKGWTDEKPE